MTKQSRQSWEERVRRFGVDPEKLDGRPFQLTTKSLQEFKSWFAIPEGAHTASAKVSVEDVGDTLMPRTRRWIINHIIGLERIEDAKVIEAIERVAGPFHCMVHAARERFVTAQDPVVAHQHYSIAEFERLVIAPGGFIDARTPMRLVVDVVQKRGFGASSTGQNDIVVKGDPGKNGDPGVKGKDGTAGENGKNLSCSACEVSQDPTAGQPGRDGDLGEDGQPAQDGGNAQDTSFDFGTIENPIYIVNIGGAGGDGGAGGYGGVGGDGGKGGDGGNCCCRHRDSRPGGKGGIGGNGGNGGKGGKGGKGATLFITCNPMDENKVVVNLGTAQGGRGGNRGMGANGGAGGPGGSEAGLNGAPGHAGNPGTDGAIGVQGTYYINGRKG